MQHCSLAALHVSSDIFAHHQDHTRGCKYSLDATDNERKYRSKHVEQPRNNKLSYTVASCLSFSYIIFWCTEPWISSLLTKQCAVPSTWERHKAAINPKQGDKLCMTFIRNYRLCHHTCFTRMTKQYENMKDTHKQSWQLLSFENDVGELFFKLSISLVKHSV